MKLQIVQIRLEADQIISLTLRDPAGAQLPSGRLVLTSR